jgi:hypothetical protein
MKIKSRGKTEELKPRIVAFLHITKDGKVIEQVGLERAPRITPKFLSNSVKLIETINEIGSELNLGNLQTISMVGKKGKSDLQLLLHLSSHNLYGITFTEKPSLEERLKKAFKI